MQWLRWAARVEPVAEARAALARKAAALARTAVHIVALFVVVDAALRLAVGRHDLAGFVMVAGFLVSGAVVGVTLQMRESRVSLRQHADEVALGLAALIIEYFALAALAVQI